MRLQSKEKTVRQRRDQEEKGREVDKSKNHLKQGYKKA
jgi:hypothetical protein